MLKSSLCDYSNAYILVKGAITVTNTAATNADANNTNIKAVFKNCAPFEKCTTEISSTQVHSVQDIDVVMSMHYLLEYSENYSKISGSLYQYCRDQTAIDTTIEQ